MKNNKKGMSAIVATVLIISITVATVTIIWVAIFEILYSEPEFRITVEECLNRADPIACDNMLEKVYNMKKDYRDLNCDVLERYDILESSTLCTSLSDILTNRTNAIEECYLSPPVIEVCEDVEIGIQIFIYDNGSIEGIVPYKTKDGSKTKAMNVIDSYDLSIEWLDNNCEPVYFPWGEISDYQCNNYKVEVILI